MKEQMNEEQVKSSEEVLRNGQENVADCTEVACTKEKKFLLNNRGVGVVEVILILVVLIALVLIFKEQLSNMVTKAMEALEKSINEVLS